MKIYLLLFVSIILFSCSKEYLAENETIESLEKEIRKTEDKRATHRFAQYEELLNVLDDEKICGTSNK